MVVIKSPTSPSHFQLSFKGTAIGGLRYKESCPDCEAAYLKSMNRLDLFLYGIEVTEQFYVLRPIMEYAVNNA